MWTSAGITAGIDMALAMIEEDHGHGMAMFVARTLVVFLKRPGGQAQFSTQLQIQAVEGPLAPLLKWIAENPAADLRAEALADRAHMSLRNFYRAFEEATGTSPADWVEQARLEIARRLLEQTAQNVDLVARLGRLHLVRADAARLRPALRRQPDRISRALLAPRPARRASSSTC